MLEHETLASPPPKKPQPISRRNKWLATRIAWTAITPTGLLLGAGALAAMQHWLTYLGERQSFIELESQRVLLDGKRIENEAKRLSIDATRQALPSQRQIDFNCESNRIAAWSWRVICSVANNNSFAVALRVEEMKLYHGTRGAKLDYVVGRDFEIQHAEWPQPALEITPASAEQFLFDVDFSRSKRMIGAGSKNMALRIAYAFDPVVPKVNPSEPGNPNGSLRKSTGSVVLLLR